MIRYDLMCEKGHAFDAWFSDSAAYDKQRKRGLVECAHCGSIKIEKQLMAPNVGAKGNKKSDVALPSAAPQQMVAGPVDPRMQVMMQMVRDFRKHVTENAENVGDKFADEARKIHYKESEARGIYGQATPNEARELLEEGIDVHAIPLLPEDQN
jgi:hypothetical protein